LQFAQGAPSDDEEDVQAQDGDEEETSSSSDELQDEDKAVERDEDEESEHGHEHQQQKHPPHKLHNGEKPLEYEKQKLVSKQPLFVDVHEHIVYLHRINNKIFNSLNFRTSCL
jgi:hypothetical protein